MGAEPQKPRTFDEQFAEELIAIEAGRMQVRLPAGLEGMKDDPAFDRAHEARMLGLAFSGGGIRSATFNLGILQGLSELRLLRYVDYLSTVSGGGYIGSWLSAWIHRTNGRVMDVEAQLGTRAAGEPVAGNEPCQVAWLRRFSNYLTPRVGLSADTLTGVAGFLRNLLLNQAILTAGIAALLFVIWLLLFPAGREEITSARATLIVGVVLFALSTLLGGFEAAMVEMTPPNVAPRRLASVIPSLCTTMICLSALLLALASSSGLLKPWKADQAREPFSLLNFDTQALLHFTTESMAVWAGALYAFTVIVGWTLGIRRARALYRKPHQRTPEAEPFLPDYRNGFAALGALAGGCALTGMLLLWLDLCIVRPALRSPLQVTVVAPLALIAMWLLTAVVHLGIVGRGFRESAREWCSRLGGKVLKITLIWLAVASITLYGPFVWHAAQREMNAAGGITWLVTTLAGVYFALSNNTGGGSGSWKEILARIAPYVFIAGLFMGLSYCAYRGVLLAGEYSGNPYKDVCGEKDTRGRPLYDVGGSIHWDGESTFTVREPGKRRCSFKAYSDIVETNIKRAWAALVCFAGILFGVAAFLSWRVDVNVFSFHGFYRNRLERCYLGASNRKRNPHPFTGLDPEDTPRLADLLDDQGRAQRPLHVINTAINLTRATKLGWQERKAASFTFTPMYCGYGLPEPCKPEQSWYQRTADFVGGRGWISQGMPMAISGAAASPNWGYHTDAWTAFLMTVFNVRLGWWMQNTSKTAAWRERGPLFGLPLLLRELLGSTNEKSNYVYLSDGGHFENLGIYELVRRRCRYVIACDAGCDGAFTFEDLGNAIRKCKIDFGIDIDIDACTVVPDPRTKRALYHCAVGRIHYERKDAGATPGYLLYIKPTLTSNEPSDVVEYAKRHPDFPHESTLDQWFSESQFESYRKLGQHSVRAVFEPALRTTSRDGMVGLEKLFTDLRWHWYAPSKAALGDFSHHGEMLGELVEQLRTDPNLRFLDTQFYPEWKWMKSKKAVPSTDDPRLPEDDTHLRAGFYHCKSLIQLMENVYVDLKLEDDWEHPDNSGWMDQFRHWSWSPMFQVTWTVCASTFGSRFRSFCERRLDLAARQALKETGKPLPDWTTADDVRAGIQALREETGMNSVEADFIFDNLRLEKEEHVARSLHVFYMTLSSPYPQAGTSDYFRFPVGVAVVARIDDSMQLRAIRIRDHLRSMGLGTQALELLLKKFDSLENHTSAPDKHSARRFTRLFKSSQARIPGKSDTDREG